MSDKTGCLHVFEVSLLLLAFIFSLVTLGISECHRREDNRRGTLPLLVVEPAHSEIRADLLGVQRQDVCAIRNVGSGVSLYIHATWEAHGLTSTPLCLDAHHAAKDSTVTLDICPNFVVEVGKKPVDAFVSDTRKVTEGWLVLTCETETGETVKTRTAFTATYDPAQSNMVYLRFGRLEIVQR